GQRKRMADILNELIAIKQLAETGRGEVGISVREPFSRWSATQGREINRRVLDAFGGEAVRSQGWNLHGFWFVVLAVLGASAFFFAPAFSYRLLFVCMFVTLIYMIYLTRSFVANYILLELELLLGFFIFLFAARMEKRKALRLFVALIGLGIIGGCLLLVSPVGEDLVSVAGRDMGMSALREKLNPVTSRYIIFSGAIDIWKRHPVIGAGPMSFMTYFPYFRRPDYFLFEISHVTIFAHNLFLDVLAETGLLGLAAFLAFLGYLGWRALKIMHASPDRTRRLAVAALFVGALGFLLSNMTDPNARWPICAGLFWASLGMVAGLVNRPSHPGEQTVLQWSNIRRPISRFLMIVLIGFSSVFVISSSVWCVNYFKAALLNHNGLEFMNLSESNLNTLRQLQQKLEQAPEGSPQREQLIKQWNKVASDYESTRLKSMEYFEKAFQTTPLFVTSYYKLGSLYARSNQLREPKVGDLKKAILTFETLRQFAPEFAQVRWNLARVNGQLSSRIAEDGGEKMESVVSGKQADVLDDIEFNRDWLLRQAMEHHRVAARQSINTNMNEYYIGFMLNQGGNFPNFDFTLSNISDAEVVASRLLHDKDKAVDRLREIAGNNALAVLAERLETYRSGKDSGQSTQQYDALREAILGVLRPAIQSENLFDEAAFEKVDKSDHLEFILGLDLEGERLRNRNRILVAETLRRDTWRHPIKEFYYRNIRLHPYEEAIREAEKNYQHWRDLLRNDIPVRRAWDNPDRSLEEVVIDAALLHIEALQRAGWNEEARAVIEEMLDIVPGNPTLLTFRSDLDKVDAMPDMHFPE
ncbi:MAG: O-antigen ligase family protein, partial [Candidatus Sumerlaeota bacterium]